MKLLMIVAVSLVLAACGSAGPPKPQPPAWSVDEYHFLDVTCIEDHAFLMGKVSSRGYLARFPEMDDRCVT